MQALRFSICVPKSWGQPNTSGADTPDMARVPHAFRVLCLLALSWVPVQAEDIESLLLQASSLSDLLRLVESERDDPELLRAWLTAMESRASGRLDGVLGPVLLQALQVDQDAFAALDGRLIRSLLRLLPEVSDPALSSALYGLIPLLPQAEVGTVVARELAALADSNGPRGLALERRVHAILPVVASAPSLAALSNLARLLPRISDPQLALQIDTLVRSGASAF